MNLPQTTLRLDESQKFSDSQEILMKNRESFLDFIWSFFGLSEEIGQKNDKKMEKQPPNEIEIFNGTDFINNKKWSTTPVKDQWRLNLYEKSLNQKNTIRNFSTKINQDLNNDKESTSLIKVSGINEKQITPKESTSRIDEVCLNVSSEQFKSLENELESFFKKHLNESREDTDAIKREIIYLFKNEDEKSKVLLNQLSAFDMQLNIESEKDKGIVERIKELFKRKSDSKQKSQQKPSKKNIYKYNTNTNLDRNDQILTLKHNKIQEPNDIVKSEQPILEGSLKKNKIFDQYPFNNFERVARAKKDALKKKSVNKKMTSNEPSSSKTDDEYLSMVMIMKNEEVNNNMNNQNEMQHQISFGKSNPAAVLCRVRSSKRLEMNDFMEYLTDELDKILPEVPGSSQNIHTISKPYQKIREELIKGEKGGLILKKANQKNKTKSSDIPQNKITTMKIQPIRRTF